MFSILVTLVAAALSGGGLAYTVTALIQQRSGSSGTGVVMLVFGLVLLGFMSFRDSLSGAMSAYQRVRGQQLVAPAVVTGTQRTTSDVTGSNRFAIAVTVYPPDLPPYRSEFDHSFGPHAEVAGWQPGTTLLTQLVSTDTGQVIFVDTIAPDAALTGQPGPLAWERVRRDYLEGDAPAYAGPQLAGVATKPWRAMEIPRTKQWSPVRLASILSGAVVGAVIGVVIALWAR